MLTWYLLQLIITSIMKMKANIYLIACVAALLCQSLRAEVFGGFMELNASWNMHLGVLVDQSTDTVHIQLSGPDSRWFAVGFNRNFMSGTYAIIVDGNGTVTERVLGAHTAGTLLPGSVTVQSMTVANGKRTVYLTRPRVGANPSYYTFADAADTIDLIYAQGTGIFLSYHGDSNKNNQKDLSKTVLDKPEIAIVSQGSSSMELQLMNLVYGVSNSLDENSTLQTNAWTTAELIELAPPGSGPIDWLFSTNVIIATTNDTRFFRLSR